MAEEQHAQHDGAEGKPERHSLCDAGKRQGGIIEHMALRPAGVGQAHDHQKHPKRCRAEVDFDQRGRAPLPARQARQHEIRGAKHGGGEAGVEGQPVAQAVEHGELHDGGKTAHRERQIHDRREHEAHDADDDETERQAVLGGGMPAGQRAEEIKRHDDHADNHQHVGGDTQRRDPHRHRGADKTAAAGEGRGDRQPPEGQRSQVVIRNGLAEYLGEEVIRRGQRDRHKPKIVESVGIPGIDDGLEHAAHRGLEKHHLRDGINPREPERRAEEIPLRGVDILRVADAEGRDGPDADEGVGGEQDEAHEARHLEQLEGGGITREDAADAERDTDIPELGGDEQPAAVAESGRRQAGHQPEAEGEGGVHTPAVDEGVLRGGGEAAVGAPLAIGQEARLMQLHRGGQLHDATKEEPEQRRAEEEQHRPLGRGVDLHLLRAVVRGGIHLRAYFFARSRAVISMARSIGRRTTPALASTQA